MCRNSDKRSLPEPCSGQSGDSRETAPRIPGQLQEALSLDLMARHYRGWVDETIPALDGHTPREAAAHAALRPKLIHLIHGLEGMYHNALKKGEPAYDPSWMWGELGLEESSGPAYIPPLAHERMASMVPGLGELCRTIAEHLRRQPGFDDASTIMTAEQIGINLEIQRFLRKMRDREEGMQDTILGDGRSVAEHMEPMINFELHRRKIFWVDESLVYLLAKTDLDVPGSDLRLPFACFLLAFTDRHMLSLSERLLSTDPNSPLSGHFLKVATVYVREETHASNRVLRLWFAFDTLGADPPYLVTHEIPLCEDSPIRLLPESPAPLVVDGVEVQECDPLRGLLQVTLNAVLYAISPGAGPQHRKSPSPAPSGRGKSEPQAPVFSSEDVFFLPGAIEISRLRDFQELERVASGRNLLHRFMVRGHWRRAAAGWQDQRMRWIAPYWKGPDIAAVIERSYKLKP